MQLSMLSQLFTKPASATLVRSDFRDDAGPSSPGLDFGGDSFGAAGKSFLLCLLRLRASYDNWCSITLAAKCSKMAVRINGN